MAIHTLNDGADIRAPKPWDERTGYWDDVSDSWKPYPSVQDALDSLTYRYIGQTIVVMDVGEQVEYWFSGGTRDGDFIKKTTSSGVGVTAINDESVIYGGTSASDLNLGYPDLVTGDMVYSKSNGVLFQKLASGEWEVRNTEILEP